VDPSWFSRSDDLAYFIIRFNSCWIRVKKFWPTSGQFLLLRSGRVGLGWVSHLWFGVGFGKFPLKIPNFSIFSPLDKKNTSLGWVKKYPASYLLGIKSMLGLGQGPSVLAASNVKCQRYRPDSLQNLGWFGEVFGTNFVSIAH